MRFGNDILDEIRTRLPCSVVVGRRVKLQKSGREWKGLSPFNTEKTPSFYVNDQKGFYHCFSSGKHGDIFRFLMETEGASFMEAVERLANDAGVTLPKAADYKPEDTQKRLDIYDALELAAQFFQGQYTGANGVKAREYVATRHLSDKTVREFRIGYAPDGRNALLEHLRGKGIRDDMIEAAGLAIRPEDGRDLYDRFRGRLMFPIQDTKGRVVAFGGRGLAADAKPKYLNSNETDVFKKGQMLFNGHRAREAAFKAKSVIVVEGYMDAIAVYQAGIEAVVATLGTAFTEEQITTLWRFAPEPIICFDGDKAGRAAAYRAIDRILPVLNVGHSFKLTFLPQGQDPDDFIRSQGVDAFRAAMDLSSPLWNVLWERELGLANVSGPDGQASFEAKINNLVNQIGDSAVKRRYQLTARLMLADLFWKANKKNTKKGTISDNLFTNDAGVRIETILLGLCVHRPDFAEKYTDRLYNIGFIGGTNGQYYLKFFEDMMIIIGAENENITMLTLYTRMTDKFFNVLNFVHGSEDIEKKLQYGWQLRARFPSIQFEHVNNYVERCFDHFISALKLRDAKRDLDSLVKHLPIEIDKDFENRLIANQRYILNHKELIHVEAHDLDEEASAMRTAAGTQGKRSIEHAEQQVKTVQNEAESILNF